MLIKQSVLKEETLKNLEKSLKTNYSFKEGEDLNSVLKEILNNRALNLYLLSFLPVNKGIKIGQTSYFDDIRIEVNYGLTIDFDKIPRKTELFLCENVYGGFKSKTITDSFPGYEKEYSFHGWPSPNEFLERINRVLSSEEIHRYLIDLKK